MSKEDDAFSEQMKDMLRKSGKGAFKDSDIDQDKFDKINEKVLNDMFRSPKKESGCFIATATYESPNSKEVMILRQWRDEYLLHSYFGRSFVKIYYVISPSIARIIKKYKFLKGVSKLVLKPIINYVRK